MMLTYSRIHLDFISKPNDQQHISKLVQIANQVKDYGRKSDLLSIYITPSILSRMNLCKDFISDRKKWLASNTHQIVF